MSNLSRTFLRKTLLAEGYLEMAGEAIRIAREFEKLDNEVAKYLKCPRALFCRRYRRKG
jgi:hypothetical protein